MIIQPIITYLKQNFPNTWLVYFKYKKYTPDQQLIIQNFLKTLDQNVEYLCKQHISITVCLDQLTIMENDSACLQLVYSAYQSKVPDKLQTIKQNLDQLIQNYIPTKSITWPQDQSNMAYIIDQLFQMILSLIFGSTFLIDFISIKYFGDVKNQIFDSIKYQQFEIECLKDYLSEHPSQSIRPSKELTLREIKSYSYQLSELYGWARLLCQRIPEPEFNPPSRRFTPCGC